MSTCDFFGTDNSFACKAEHAHEVICYDHGASSRKLVCTDHLNDLVDMAAASAGFRIELDNVVLVHTTPALASSSAKPVAL